jgi:hypothetical protein
MPTRTARLAEYERAAAEFRSRAALVAAAQWERPRREGKWSPAQETEHVVLSHELFLAQLGGGPEMRVIATGWKVFALRWLVFPYILWTGRFPRARAPRESRPTETALARGELFTRLDRATRGVVESLQRDDVAARPPLRHPYFGKLSVMQVVRLSTVHTRHHSANMPPQRTAGG